MAGRQARNRLRRHQIGELLDISSRPFRITICLQLNYPRRGTPACMEPLPPGAVQSARPQLTVGVSLEARHPQLLSVTACGQKAFLRAPNADKNRSWRPPLWTKSASWCLHES